MSFQIHSEGLSLRRTSPVMALSWLNLPCALKAAIGIGKRTSALASAAPQGRSKPPSGPGSGPRSSPPNTIAMA
jgi:hypothetical protein